MPLIKRHRQVQTWLAQEFTHGLHALHLELLTPEEFEESTERASPPCKNS
jgi:stress-induced morphogen